MVYGKGGEGSPKRVEIFFSQILDNKLRNGTTIEGGGEGESRKIGKGELLLEQIIVENMFPRLCIHTLDTSHVYVVKNYGKGSEENQKGGKKRGGIFFI